MASGGNRHAKGRCSIQGRRGAVLGVPDSPTASATDSEVTVVEDSGASVPETSSATVSEEPAPAVVEETSAPVLPAKPRRGRPPGSKNKRSRWESVAV
ncbi:MAG: hypothetical protein PHV93_03265 [Candidatus Pacebacteria bacterium]|nr:hypothetical protein [Candidatus Paceibacterota bacterium]